MDIVLDGRKLEPPAAQIERSSGLIWGPSGAGKTVLASTAPKDILWINFDPDGPATLAQVHGHDNIKVLDYASEPHSCVMKFRNEDPIGLDKFLKDNENFRSVIFDSLTTYGEKGLHHGVIVAAATVKGRGSTLEDPGYGGYGNKNTWMNMCVMNLLKVTSKYNRHMYFIAHEDKPERDSQGNILSYSIMLGSSLIVQVPVKLSEIWRLEDTGKKRRIAIRSCRMRKPMKTRMFKTDGEPEFDWEYDPDTGKGGTIERWYNKWKDSGGKKLVLPEAKQ